MRNLGIRFNLPDCLVHPADEKTHMPSLRSYIFRQDALRPFVHIDCDLDVGNTRNILLDRQEVL